MELNILSFSNTGRLQVIAKYNAAIISNFTAFSQTQKPKLQDH